MASIVITPETTRIDLLDALAQEGYGIADTDVMPSWSSDAYRWRCICDELVQAMSDEQACGLMEFVARMHDVDFIELDSVAYTIMQALDCTPEAAVGLREWVFDSYSDSLDELRTLENDLRAYGALYSDFNALEADEYTERDGVLYEKQVDGAPIPCEADVWFDASFGYFVMWR